METKPQRCAGCDSWHSCCWYCSCCYADLESEITDLKKKIKEIENR